MIWSSIIVQVMTILLLIGIFIRLSIKLRWKRTQIPVKRIGSIDKSWQNLS